MALGGKPANGKYWGGHDVQYTFPSGAFANRPRGFRNQRP
jgi:hypothetical protein